ncbi:unnamed protein product [Trichobilharzia szidati]|nr:unnamed protein product [Trichobilharzia szidati]
MCSIEKNECFCKPGYVSIQESYGITCKTLLTNLKCQVDSDCVHVINSACHPGAGYCACPGGTIYVPQDHACRQSAENNQNQFCSKCRQVNGVCYYYYHHHNNYYYSPSSSSSSSSPSSSASSGSSASAFTSQTTNSEAFNHYKRYMYKNHDLVPFTSQTDTMFNGFLNYAHNTEMFGCSCPHNTGMLASIPSVNFLRRNQSHSRDSQNQSSVESHETKDTKIHGLVPQSLQELPQWYFCKAIIVDIWEYCNHVDILCRAKNARCVKTEHSSNLIQFSCQCLPGYIPVYQKHLNYYECFRQLEANHSSCTPCFHSNGKCYTMNEQNIDSSIGCLCPNNLQPTLTTSTPTDLIHQSHTNNNKDSDNNDRSAARNTFMTDLLPTHTGVEYEMCGENLVNVFCQRHLLEICLSPISQPPYQNLAENLHLRRSIAFVTNLTLHQNFIDTCRLDVKRNSLQGKQWNHTTVNPVRAEQHQVLCKTIDWRQDPTRTPCGISITEYMSGHLYTGYLAVITSQEHRNQESDLLFQFTCKTNNDVPHRVPGQVFERNSSPRKCLFKFQFCSDFI